MTVPSGAMRMRNAANEAAEAAFVPALPFALVSSRETLVGRGCLRLVGEADRPSGARARAFFAEQASGPRIIVGALPFAAGAPAYLYQPAEVTRGAVAFPPALVRAAEPARSWRVEAEPPLAAYRAAVAEVLARMARGDDDLRKVVLSRSLRLLSDGPIEASALLRALAQDEHVTAFCVPLAGGPTGRALVGATPELLVARQGVNVVSHPLAGSARRLADASADRAAAQALMASDKDRREHAEVVTAILDLLAPHCAALAHPGDPQLTSTATMWHLGTRIEGRLRDESLSALDLAALLHPTPAVCGTPREAAARTIAELEGYERGFYAGAAGWVDEAGDGAWHVAIRCAEIAGDEARLYAGAGIVPGSDPVAEGEETSAKFAALLGAFGIDEDGRATGERQA